MTACQQTGTCQLAISPALACDITQRPQHCGIDDTTKRLPPGLSSFLHPAPLVATLFPISVQYIHPASRRPLDSLSATKNSIRISSISTTEPKYTASGLCKQPSGTAVVPGQDIVIYSLIFTLARYRPDAVSKFHKSSRGLHIGAPIAHLGVPPCIQTLASPSRDSGWPPKRKVSFGPQTSHRSRPTPTRAPTAPPNELGSRTLSRDGPFSGLRSSACNQDAPTRPPPGLQFCNLHQRTHSPHRSHHAAFHLCLCIPRAEVLAKAMWEPRRRGLVVALPSSCTRCFNTAQILDSTPTARIMSASPARRRQNRTM